MNFLTGLRCRECGEKYPADARYVCEMCFGPIEPVYDDAAIRAHVTRQSIAAGPRSLWRYEAFLPARRLPRIDLGAGFTPLIEANNLGARLGLKHLYLKNDTVNPTFSFKDRVVSVAAAKAVELGFTALACVSTGNLAGAVAAAAAKAGLPAYIFVPADIEPTKIVGAGVYGATIIAVEGTYDQANRLATEAADSYGWAFVNITLRPYYAEGSKTLAYEVAEQLGWRAPDRVIVPIASGALFTKINKGFREWVDLGLVPNHLPKMVGAQAAGCSPVATAFRENTREIRAVKPQTIAKSLAIGSPADGPYAIDVARQSGGAIEAVREEAIVEGIQLLARTEGIFAETAGGVVIGALEQQADAGAIDPDETVVAYITGNGLKTQEVLQQPASFYAVAPTWDAFQALASSRAFGRAAMPIPA